MVSDRGFVPLSLHWHFTAHAVVSWLFTLLVNIPSADWGIGDVNAYGNHLTTRVATPNIDALAADGVLFTNGYSASPVCSPSRTAWM